MALIAEPVPAFASAAEAAGEAERERTQALYGEEEQPAESVQEDTGVVPTPAESEAVRKRMSELAWEINRLDGQMAGLVPEEAVVLQRERDEKMREYEAGETELYAMGAIPTEEELREVMGLGQESESGISFRSLPNFSSIYDIFLITHMQCRMYSNGYVHDVINYTIQEKPSNPNTVLYQSTTINMRDSQSSVKNPLFSFIVSEGAGYVASLITAKHPIANKVISFLASEAVSLLLEKDWNEVNYSHMTSYNIAIDGITTNVYVRRSGGEYHLSNAVSSIHINAEHNFKWYNSNDTFHNNHIEEDYYIQGDFQNSTAARDAVDTYEYYKTRNIPIQPLTQRPVSLAYVTQAGITYYFRSYFADTPHTLTSDAL